MQYRAEIDGLRALAVIPVILYHAGLPWLPGGFIGVDVFFVISGYLITSILLNDLEAGSFSIAGFYERRARRILPALFLVLVCTLPFVWWLLLPHEMIAFARSLIAVIVFASNLLFWQESDYFATESEFIPLLHTWSLAVEEQYYLLFPLLLWAGWKLRRQWLAGVLLLIALASLGLSEWLWRTDPSSNFYLLPSRVWELMAGALAALYLQHRPQPSGAIAHALGLVGLILVLAAMLAYDTGTPFPSVYALLPVLGTVLIIVFAAPQNLAGQILSLKPFVWVGLVSYSAYLWHQPLLVFFRLASAEEPSMWGLVGVGLLALPLAWLSWRFVERPFRDRERFGRGQIFGMALAGSVLLVGVGGVMLWGEGFSGRFG